MCKKKINVPLFIFEKCVHLRAVLMKDEMLHVFNANNHHVTYLMIEITKNPFIFFLEFVIIKDKANCCLMYSVKRERERESGLAGRSTLLADSC